MNIERELAALRAEVAELKRRVPARIGRDHAEATVRYVAQTAHGLAVKTAVVPVSGGWSAYSGSGTPGGLVSAVLSPDAFEVTTHGIVTRLSGLTAGQSYYAIAGGTLVAYDFRVGFGAPIVLHALSATTALVLIGWWQGLAEREGVVGVFTVPNTWTKGTPLAYDGTGTLVRANATAAVTAQVFGVIAGGLYTVGSDNVVLVRRAGYIASAGVEDPLGLTLHASLTGAVPPSTYYLDTSAGGLVTTPPASNATAVVEVTRSGIIICPQACTAIQWTAVNNKPTAFPPSGSIGLTVDSADTTNAAALTFSGSIGSQTWTFYEKRPRFNARWLLGYPLASGTPLTDGFMRFDGTTWDNVTLLENLGELLTHDGTDMVAVDASTPLSVVGVTGNVAAAPAPIVAGADGDVLTRVGTTLVFAPPSGGGFTPTSIELKTSGSGNWVVPAGIYRVRVILVGAGGGAGTSASVITIGYVAFTSGGSPTTALTRQFLTGGGGAGALIIVEFDVAPGDIISYSIGAAGVGDSVSGGNTTITLSGTTLTAGGGAGGSATAGEPGVGGSPSGTVPGSNAIGYGRVGAPGAPGALLINGNGVVGHSAPGYHLFSPAASGVFGRGETTYRTASTGGAVAFMY